LNNLIVHVALITFYVDTPEEVRIKFLKRFQRLAVRCGGKKAGIQGLIIMPDLNLGKKPVSLIQLSAFKDIESFQAFRRHPLHAQLRNELRDYADWLDGTGSQDLAKVRAFLATISSI
jgi:hypothetical protein